MRDEGLRETSTGAAKQLGQSRGLADERLSEKLPFPLGEGQGVRGAFSQGWRKMAKSAR